MASFENFKDKTLNQIRWWAWAAAVLPITALAGLFFVWSLDDQTLWGYAMIAGETAMFGIAVTWWWWALYVLRNLVKHWDGTRQGISHVKDEISIIREMVKDIVYSGKDK